MKRAIEVLEKESQVCKDMIKWYEDELYIMSNNITADGLVVSDYESKKYELEKVGKDCLKAIKHLKNK